MEDKNPFETHKTAVVDLSLLDSVGGNFEALSVDERQECKGGAKKKIPVGVWRSKKSPKKAGAGTSCSDKGAATRVASVNGKSPTQRRNANASPEKKHRPKLSASDPSWEKTHLQRGFNSMQFKNDCRGMHPSSSSTSSQSSGNFRMHRERRNSDSQPEEGSFLPYGLRAQHAAHRCAWSESDSGSTTSPGYVSMRRSADELLDIRENSIVSSYPGTPVESKKGSGGRPSFRRQLSKPGRREARFEMYMPLCEVQQGLKKGEVIEGVLRINPRNYEDAYISAPDGQMDIYVGGIHDRNRALNGDVVAVQLNSPEEWKVLWDVIKDYEEQNNCSLFYNPLQFPPAGFEQDSTVPAVDGRINSESAEDPATGWDMPVGQWEPHTIEILGFEKFQNQVAEYHKEKKEAKNKRRKNKNKNKNSSGGYVRKLPEEENASRFGESVQAPSQPTGDDSNCNTQATVEETRKAFQNINIHNDSASSTSEAMFLPSDRNLVVTNGSTVIPKDTFYDKSGARDGICQTTDAAAGSHFASDPRSDGAENGPSNPIVSPEELLNVDGYSLLDDASSDDVSDDEVAVARPVGVTVALEDLSEEEFTESISGESTCSHHLEQLVEDGSFLASQQDAANNNSSGTNIRTVNEDVSVPEFSSYIDNSDVYNEEARFGLNGSTAAGNVGAAASRSVTSEPEPRNLSLDNSISSYHVDNSLCFQSSFRSSASPVVPDHADAECDKIGESSTIVTPTNEPQTFASAAGTKGSNFADPASDAPPAPATDEAVQEEDEDDDVGINEDASNASKDKESASPRKKKRRKKNKKNRSAPQKREVEVKSEAANRQSPVELCINMSPTERGSLTVSDLMKHPHWEKFIQKTGKVVYVLEEKHTRIAVGHLKLMQDKNPNWALFSPNDHRLPRIMIPITECPEGFYNRPQDFSKCLFICKISKWDEMSIFPRGKLMKNLGDAGDIETESEAMLVEYGIDFSEFPDAALKGLPLSDDSVFSMSDVEVLRSFRRDFRSECVFTIDPATARDLDDALSCKVRDDGLLEVGVHIADVTHFLKEGTALDDIAADRATSVYLVQRVIPMLPRILCEKLCSLNPGEDKLTLSVVWTMDKNAKVVDSWCGRSIIRSCAKLSYEHAQDMIENPDKQWNPSEHPPLFGNFGISDLVQRVLQLHALALQLRKKRFDEGALRLDQIKLQFSLNKDKGLPNGFSVYQQKDSHRLVEEFMLLANMHVAHAIYEAFPRKALLRLHPPPQLKLMEDVVNMCATMGIHLDATTAGTLQACLAQYFGLDEYSRARTLVLTALCAKPMNRALYFCTGCVEDAATYRHYALNVPLYTHFTSPIRRYADVLVHRMLIAALGIGNEPKLSPKEVHKQALHCNDKKYISKQVSELSSELFLGAFVKECGPLEERAMVMGVMDHSFDVLVLRLGVVKRVYTDNIPLAKTSFKRQRGVPELLLHWQDGRKDVISIFSLVDVVISSAPDDPLKFNATLKCLVNEL